MDFDYNVYFRAGLIVPLSMLLFALALVIAGVISFVKAKKRTVTAFLAKVGMFSVVFIVFRRSQDQEHPNQNHHKVAIHRIRAEESEVLHPVPFGDELFDVIGVDRDREDGQNHYGPGDGHVVDIHAPRIARDEDREAPKPREAKREHRDHAENHREDVQIGFGEIADQEHHEEDHRGDPEGVRHG